VEVLFDDVVFTDQLYRFYSRVLLISGQDKRFVEFRPTHHLAIKLPLTRHGKTGRMCWYVDRETLKPIENLDYIQSIRQFPTERFRALMEAWDTGEDCRADAIKDERPKATLSELDKPYVFGETLTEPGTRHKVMLQMAVACRYSGDSEQACRDTLVRWYLSQPAQMIRSSRKEVEADIEGILCWAYGPAFQVSGGKWAVITEQDVRQIQGLKRKSEQKTLF
jgi:hypothetical protein